MPRTRPALKFIGLFLGFLVLSYYCKPFVDSGLIAAGRLLDRWEQSHEQFLVRQDTGDVITLTSRSVSEIDGYLKNLRHPAADLVASSAAAGLPDTTLVNDPAAREARLKQLRQSLAFPPPVYDSAALPAVSETPLGEDQFATYRRLEFSVLPGVSCRGVLALPKVTAFGKRLPLIIAAHGRGGQPDPKTTQEAIASDIDRNLASWAVQSGYAVWLPMFVFYADKRPENIRELLTARAIEAGTTLPSIEIAKTCKAIDILSRRPEIDPARIAMAGHSYGGFYALYTAALDPRIRAVIISAYLNDREEILDSNEPSDFSDWRFPGSATEFRDPSLAALVAPRPLLMISGTYDELFPIAGARVTAEKIRQVYASAGAGAAFEFHEFPGRHDFNGPAAAAFMKNLWPPEK